MLRPGASVGCVLTQIDGFVGVFECAARARDDVVEGAVCALVHGCRTVGGRVRVKSHGRKTVNKNVTGICTQGAVSFESASYD